MDSEDELGSGPRASLRAGELHEILHGENAESGWKGSDQMAGSRVSWGGGSPKRDGFYNGKSHLEMDELGVPLF